MRHAREAYRAYRRERFTTAMPTGWLVSALRGARDAIIAALYVLRGQGRDPPIEKVEVSEIAFVGVWDTVSAYGLPIAELTRGIDEWVWPLSMPDYALSPKVKKACHALALDDERDTFHPLIWDEVAEKDLIGDGKVERGRLQQVWFAGMHSDVGGGYPNDSLAYVSLNWMMGEATVAGLRFRAEAIDEVKRTLNEFGPMHDSRRGFAGYYRYQPRKIGARIWEPDPTTLIMQDPDPQMRALLTTVKIHESVLSRIRAGLDRYAPIVLPGNFEVVQTAGSVAPSPESAVGSQSRVDRQHWVWNDIWKKRLNYFATVGASLFLVLLPSINGLLPPSACTGPQCLLTPVISTVGGVLPAFLQPWIESFAASPGLFAIGAIVIALLLMKSASLQTRIRDGMRELWRQSLGLPAAAQPATQSAIHLEGRPNDWVYRLRTNPAYLKVLQTLKWEVLPTVFGIAALVAGLALILALTFIATHRVQLAAAERSDRFCSRGATQMIERSATAPGRFTTASLCWPTGSRVEAGHRYRITLTVTGRWWDSQIPTDPSGFESDKMPWRVRYGAILLRRSLGDRWFQPLVKVVPAPGSGSSYVEALEIQQDKSVGSAYTADFDAARTGELFLFVNDAILPWDGLTEYFYANNLGGAAVRIERID